MQNATDKMDFVKVGELLNLDKKIRPGLIYDMLYSALIIPPMFIIVEQSFFV